MTDPPEEQSIPFREALRFWFKLGWISFGGPAGQIAIMHRELVEQRRWISEERFLHALNFCMLLPGPEAQQLAIYIGWLKHRVLGGAVAGVLFVLPGFLIITGIAVLYVTLGHWAPMQSVFFGLKAAVLAIVIEALVRIARRALKTQLQWAIAAAAFVAIFAFAVPFPLIVLGAAALALLARARRVRPHPDGVRPLPQGEVSGGSTMRIVVVCLALWFGPLILIYATLGPSHVLALEGVFFSKMAIVTFGGAYAVLAYVAQEAVQRYAWLSTDDMMQGLALAETTPGPLILVLTFVGFLAAFNAAAPFDPITAGLLGALLTTWVTFVPCFLWILVGAPHVERLRRNEALTAALANVTAAVVGVILNLAVWFGMHALFGEVRTIDVGPLHMSAPEIGSLDWRAAAIAVAAGIALLRFKAPMLPVLGAAAAAGLALT